MADLINYEKGHVLFKEGDIPDALYIIDSGKIVITKKRGAVELELVVLEKGQVLGEMGFFDDKNRSATAKTLTAVKVIEVKYDKLRRIYDTYPDYFKTIISSIVERLRRTNNRVRLLEQASASIDYTGKSEKHKLLTESVMLKITTLISFIANKFGEKRNKGVAFKSLLLKNHGMRTFEIPMSRISAALEALGMAEFVKVNNHEESGSEITVLDLKVIDNYVAWCSEEIYKPNDDKIKLSVLSLEAMKILFIYGRNGYYTTYKIKNPKDVDEWIDKEIWELNIVPHRQELANIHGIDLDKLSFKELIMYGLVEDVLAKDANNILVRYDKEQLEFLYTSYKIIYYMNKVSTGEQLSASKSEFR